ncbi:hypothetical protein ACROYT_G041231 [Oculina patagonica]
MRSSLNVRFILQLSCVIAIVAAGGNNTAPVSTPLPAKKSENSIIVNVHQNTGNAEKAIKFLAETLEKKFQQLVRVVNATTRGKPSIESGSSFASCKDIYVNHKSRGKRAYFIQMDSGKVPVFCHMTSHGLGACGGGGWTLAMKTDGAKASSQTNCNKEGFNVVSTNSAYSNARIGVLGDNNDCQTCDSRIGFGTGGNPDDSNKCGNEACCLSDNEDKHIKAMGYILVQ